MMIYGVIKPILTKVEGHGRYWFDQSINYHIGRIICAITVLSIVPKYLEKTGKKEFVCQTDIDLFLITPFTEKCFKTKTPTVILV
jgi:hypothetical protein